MLSLAPSFIEKIDQKSLDITYDEKPEPQDLPESIRERNFFIFLVDRSGSMSGDNIETTKEALKLFLKSLPADSMFEVISFGSGFSLLSNHEDHNPFSYCHQVDASQIENVGFDYTDENVTKAIQIVSDFQANMGGTEILKPLTVAINLKTNFHGVEFKKKIFLLTDGEVDSPEKVVWATRKAADQGQCKVHTFGIGSGCSKKLVRKVAKAGDGTCSIVMDNSELKSIVIQALGRANEPQYSNVQMKITDSQSGSQHQLDLAAFNNSSAYSLSDKFSLYRNYMLVFFAIVSKAQFEALQVSFTSEKHPLTGLSLNSQWAAKDFKMVPSITDSDNDQLFKVAAR